jgi:hypothetical protein
MPQEFAPWTSSKKHKLLGVPPGPRYKDQLDVAYYSFLKSHPEQASVSAPRWCADISQGLERKHWWAEPHTLTQTGIVYVYALDRVLDGEDCARRSIVVVHVCFSPLRKVISECQSALRQVVFDAAASPTRRLSACYIVDTLAVGTSPSLTRVSCFSLLSSSPFSTRVCILLDSTQLF